MFFNDLSLIPQIAKNTGFSIFVLSNPNYTPSIKNLLILSPEEKSGKISIESVRDFVSLTTSRQSTTQFFLVKNPETMSEEATNCFLKTLEEPKENYHFVFFTKTPASLLPTILSRAELFIEKQDSPLDAPVDYPEKVKIFAKRLMTASKFDLPALAKEISDKKDRNLALNIISATIELSYKSFFKTKNPAFLKNLENYLTLYDNIQKNGHIKLHFLADLI